MKPNKHLKSVIPSLSALLAGFILVMACVQVESEPAIKPPAVSLAGINPATVSPSVAARVRDIRSLTYYNREPWPQFQLAPFEEALDGMHQIGANTVWLILPWHQFQPVALPAPQWNQVSLDNLEAAVSAAEKRGMSVIAPLCYLGPGWEPKGIDSHVWTVEPAYYAAFSRFVLDLIDKLSAHHNLIFLLYTEGCEPKMDTLRQYPVAVKSFQAWAHAINPSPAFWNARWGTAYATWNAVQPIDYYTERGNWKRVEDHYRWVAAIMRETHGALARKIRAKVGGTDLIGYHDYSLIARNYSHGDGPIPPDNPYDFLSLSIYFDPSYKAPSAFEDTLYRAFARCRTEYPGLPLALLETGASSSEVGPEAQAAAIQMETQFTKAQGLGINIWMWKDYVFTNQKKATFGMIAQDGTPKPAFETLKNNWR